jgi:hypothetical protein
MSDAPVTWTVPDGLACEGRALFGSRPALGGTLDLAPWEVVAVMVSPDRDT